eukprot:CAMPEP_0206470598 /NCGR_PEP_ID=MMETSP0324_2-20121206/31035_1 /ASSEMBLY_ACC=CAM_ASM_000836 /TAXON_ID=2866 /ORGANISM="Crypthecodinium cohnii, Strain Seligo" /LENGTH=154 /DNA_ID=CAMNT_0053944707 /DNA_START=43 /DNA_END=507 /DNA_ORIENTATION=+
MSGITADVSDPMPTDKGGTCPWGRWLQDKEETVLVHIPLPEGCIGRDVKVNFSKKSMEVTIFGMSVVKGELFDGIDVDESVWQLVNDKGDAKAELEITLQKRSPGWWNRVFLQDAAIDTSRFDDVPNIIGQMKEHELQSSREMVARMFGWETRG